MKHLVFAIASILAVAAWAEDEQPTVTPVDGASAVQVDVVKYANPPQHAIVAVRAGSLADGGAVSVHDYVKTSTLDVGTVLYVLNGTGYQSYQLQEDTASGAKVWVAAVIALPGGVAEVTKPSDSLKLNVGTAFWIVQPSTEETKNIVIYGAPVAPPSEPQALTKGRTLVANLAVSNITINERIANATAGDMIITVDGSRYSYYNGRWGQMTSKGFVEKIISIALGGGFWYMAKGENAEINWGATGK